jgi:hypothetical protein
MKRILLSGISILITFIFTISPSSAQRAEEGTIIPLSPLAGFANCPSTARNEVFLLTYARDAITPSTATIISVTNLGTRDAIVICQFLSALGNFQIGSDAALSLGPGDTLACGTRILDPLGIFVIDADAATGAFDGKGRICSSSTSLAATARVSSDPSGVHTINIIKKSQKGD